MAISSKRVESLLSDARVAIKNALDHPEIKEKIISFGYDDERLQKGIELCSIFYNPGKNTGVVGRA